MGKAKKVSASALEKALNELEENLEKGDPVTGNPTEGGLQLEGAEPLSHRAKGGGGSSSMSKKVASSSSDSSSGSRVSKKVASSSSSSGSRVSKKVASSSSDSSSGSRVSKKMSMSDRSSSSDSSSDDRSSGRKKKAKKSLSARAWENDTLRKGIEVTGFLKEFVEEQSNTVEELRKAVADGFEEVSDRIAALSQQELELDYEPIVAAGQDFNRRLAKAIVGIGNTVTEHQAAIVEVRDLLRRVLRLPVDTQRRQVISKSEIVDPPLAGGVGGGDVDLDGISRRDALDYLISKAEKGEIDENRVIEWEARGYDWSVIPTYLKKSLVQDLTK